jgi:predicted HTH transcriptional regulator
MWTVPINLIQTGKITNRDVRDMFKISNEGALKEIRKLLLLGVIKSQGKGRSLYYSLK